MAEETLWDGPPPIPDADLVKHDLSCQGVMGISLQKALLSLQQQQKCPHVNSDETIVDDDDSRNGASHDSANFKCIALSQTMSNRILLAFGEAVSESQKIRRHETRRSVIPRKRKAPNAILRGQIDHYNRHGRKWRVLVKNCQILKRSPLNRNRRKRERPSLWRTVDRDQVSPVRLESVEILAYNDIE